MLLSAVATAALLDRHDVRLRRHLGQNFVVDPNTIRRMVGLANLVGDERVIEVGPGFGALTLGLLDRAEHVTAIELSAEVAAVLREVIETNAPDSVDRLTVHVGDATRIDIGSLDPEATVMISNLPYGPAARVVLQVLVRAPGIERQVVMVQREVAERLAADVGDESYGLPSLRRAMNASAQILGSVSAEVFLPRPRVASAILEVRRLTDPVPTSEQDGVMALARPAFAQRRKMLRSSLRSLVAADRFEDAGVDASARPEQLDVDAWRSLVRAVEASA